MIRPSSPLVPALLVLCCFFIGGVSRSEAEEASAAGWKKLEFTGQPLEGLRVALDVGHSRLTPGAISARGRGEFLFNVSTARVIAGFLEKAGAKVILINADGAITGLADRAVLAGKEKADCFISVHHDSVNDKYLQNWVHEGVTRP